MSTTITEPWRQTLKTTHAYGQLCFAVEDFSYFEGRVALQEKAPLLYRTQYRNITNKQDIIGRYGVVPSQSAFAGYNNSDGIDQVKAVADEASQQVTIKTKELADSLEKEAKTKPSDSSEVPAWKEKLRKKNEDCKAALNKMMDDSMEKATASIEKLPEPLREPAANAYTSCYDYLMATIAKIKEFLDKAWKAIGDLWNSIVKGVQVWVEGAVSTIKEWAGDALGSCASVAGKVANVFASLFG
jgi:hypothetical protein